jgi:hypothetical protein
MKARISADLEKQLYDPEAREQLISLIGVQPPSAEDLKKFHKLALKLATEYLAGEEQNASTQVQDQKI